jgi:hypothetical protein
MRKPDSNIKRLVDHHGGPVATSKLLGGKPVHQEIARWVARGWASPHHLFKLEKLLPEGMAVRDLAADKDAAKNPPSKATKHTSRPPRGEGGERRKSDDTLVREGSAADLMVPTSVDRRKAPRRSGKGR